jgi:hypothetical protein
MKAMQEVDNHLPKKPIVLGIGCHFNERIMVMQFYKVDSEKMEL